MKIWLETLAVFGTIELYIWRLRNGYPELGALVIFGLAVCILRSIRNRDGFAFSAGLRLPERRAWAIMAAVIAVNLVIIIACSRGTTIPSFANLASGFAGYCIRAFWQQFIANAYFTAQFLLVAPHPFVAIALSAILFCLVHFPNPVLMPICLVNGAIGAWFFFRYHSLLPGALCHAVIGTAIAFFLSGPSHNLKIAQGF